MSYQESSSGLSQVSHNLLHPPKPDYSNRLLAPHEFTPGILSVNGQFHHSETSTGLAVFDPNENPTSEIALIDPGTRISYPFLLYNLIQANEPQFNPQDPHPFSQPSQQTIQDIYQLIHHDLVSTTPQQDFYKKRIFAVLRKINKLVLTHLHPDHSLVITQLVKDILRSGGAPKVIAPIGSVDEMNHLHPTTTLEDLYPWIQYQPFPIDQEINDGEVIHLRDITIEGINTPGHTDPHFAYEIATSAGQILIYAGDADGCFLSNSNLPKQRDAYANIYSRKCDVLVTSHGYPDTPEDSLVYFSPSKIAPSPGDIHPTKFRNTKSSRI